MPAAALQISARLGVGQSSRSALFVYVVKAPHEHLVGQHAVDRHLRDRPGVLRRVEEDRYFVAVPDHWDVEVFSTVGLSPPHRALAISLQKQGEHPRAPTCTVTNRSGERDVHVYAPVADVGAVAF